MEEVAGRWPQVLVDPEVVVLVRITVVALLALRTLAAVAAEPVEQAVMQE